MKESYKGVLILKIGITAASGNLGAEIIKASIALIGKESVTGLARTPSKAAHLGIEVHPGDYNSRGDLEKSLKSIDTLLLVSGNDEPTKRIGQHRNVLQAAKTAGVKRIVYTSVQGGEEGTTFSPIVKSNRQTEEDIRNSGLEWVIGRNGIYIEPDIEYIEMYNKLGGIHNCAGVGRCGYTTRTELAYAYARMLTEKQHKGKTYNLHGEAITQYQLADYLNLTFITNLIYEPITVEAYRQDRTTELGQFIGNIIAGIYEGIRKGEFDNPSHFSEAAGREHQSWKAYFESLSKQ